MLFVHIDLNKALYTKNPPFTPYDIKYIRETWISGTNVPILRRFNTLVTPGLLEHEDNS